MYHDVLGKTPPPGLHNLRVSGRQVFIKQWTWMSFEGNQKALDQVIQGRERQYPPDEPIRMPPRPARSWLDGRDEWYVGWPDVYKVAKPEYYVLSGGDGTWLWGGVIILDRAHGRGWIYASGD